MVYIKSGFAPVIPLTHSRIGINNIARTGTVTASTAAAGFPAIAAANPLTYEFWKPTTVPATWTVDAGAAVTCDYLGVASHTLGTSATTLTLQHSTDNSTWEDVETVTPSTNAPIIILFPPVSRRYWRIVLSGNIALVGVVNIGKVLEMERPCFAGLSPIDFARQTVIRPNTSEGGQWLGRSILRQGSQMSVSYKHLTYDWYKTNFDPFVEQARSYPFFFAWRPQGYADSVGYVWTNTDITPSTMGIKSRLEVSFAMEGLSLE
jgi:hypothetical protein